MRASQWALTATPQKIVDKVTANTVFMVFNRSAANYIYLQFGNMPGHVQDAWPIRPGDVWVLDPRIARDGMDAIWLWTDLPGISNVVLLG